MVRPNESDCFYYSNSRFGCCSYSIGNGRPMIIGFHGCKGVGKDTAGAFLVEEMEFTKVAFADVLKEAVANLFDIPVHEVDDLKDSPAYVELNVDWQDQYISRPSGGSLVGWSRIPWREFLQRFGTEMGRNTFGQGFWVQQWEEYLYRNSIQEDNIVATDVRFQNEASKIQSMGGTIVEIIRQGHEPDGHESEEPLPRILVDAQIINNGTIDELKVDVYNLYKELQRA